MRSYRIFIAALLLITVACLWPVGRLGFIGYDDIDYVYQNQAVQSGLNPDSIAWAFGGAHAGNWHPVTWLSHMLDCELFGLNPHEEHWVNLGFHAANVLLVFLWLAGLTGARWRSFFVAALFAAHPLHVQSVAWISERKDVLSGFFFLLTLIGYTHYCRNRSVKTYLLVLLWLALGLMSKPMLVTTPFVLLLLDFWPLARNHIDGRRESAQLDTVLNPSINPSGQGKSGQAISVQKPSTSSPQPSPPLGEEREKTRTVSTCAHRESSPLAEMAAWIPLLLEKIPFFLLCAAAGLATLWAQHSGEAMDSLENFSVPARCAHAVVAYVLYLGKLFWPVDLAILYPLSSGLPNLMAILGSVLLLVSLFAAGLFSRRTRPYLLVGWCWFFIMLLPVIGLIQVGLQSIADRYTYLPSIGLFIAIVWGTAEIAQRARLWRTLATAAGFACALACMVDARYQLRFWHDNVTLFQHVVEVSPRDNCLGHFYLGLSYAEIGRLDFAEDSLRAALKVMPHFALAKSRLGNILLVQKKFAEAEVYLASGAAAHPEDPSAQVTLGMALAGQGKYAAAQSEYETAQRLAPGNPAINQLLSANTTKAEAERTLIALSSRLNHQPDAGTRLAAASASITLERYPEAVEHYQAALVQTPDSAECLNNFAWLLATCPAESVRNGARAVPLARRACELTQYKRTMFIGTLAAACAEAGQFDEAVVNAGKACDNASANGESDLLESNRRLLALYQSHQAYHEGMDVR